MAKSRQSEDQNPPSIGDKVRVGTSETVHTITSVSPNGTTVSLNIEGTNLERFRVPVEDLTFVDRRQIAKVTLPPEKPRIDVERIHERLVVAQHNNVQRLSGEVAQLKQLLAFDGAPTTVGRDLDKLCVEVEESWDAAIRAIMDTLEIANSK